MLGDEFISSSSIVLDKKISGDFYCLEEVIIDVDAYITGKIITNQCVIKGRVSGNVLSLKNVVIKNTAIVEGEITAGAVEVESGAVINGCITLQQGLQAPELIKKVREGYLDDSRKEFLFLEPTELPSTQVKNEPVLVNTTDLDPPADPIPESLPNKPTPSKITIPDNSNDSNWW